jgi:hypothetical protein
MLPLAVLPLFLRLFLPLFLWLFLPLFLRLFLLLLVLASFNSIQLSSTTTLVR